MVVPSLSLVHRPTPTQFLPRLSERLGAKVWVKRDDLTGLGLSGNKVRKLEYLLDGAKDAGVDAVITTGGLQSNHARATAVACRQLGLSPHLLLRGEPEPVPSSNHLLDHLLGASITYCSAETYSTRRDAVMEAMAERLRAEGHHPLVIPEGGSNGLGAMAYVAAAEEISDQLNVRLDATFVAVGSGGTLAGLALSKHLGQVLGVAVCDDRQTFVDRVRALTQEASTLGAPSLRPVGEAWDVLEDYRGPGYGLATPEVWETIRWMAEHEGLFLDPVYTGKAMCGLISEVEAGRVGGNVLFWHTGGAFALFGRGAEMMEYFESPGRHHQSQIKEKPERS